MSALASRFLAGPGLSLPVGLALALACTPPTMTPPPKTPSVPARVDEKPEPAPAERFPATARQDLVDKLHGHDVADPYRWLEDASDARVQAWMNEQQAFSRDRLDRLPGRAALAERMNALTYLDAVSAPARYGTRYFYTRSHKDKEKAIYYYREGRDGAEQVLIDPNLLSDDGSVSVHGTYPSDDGRYVAYKLSRNNADAATMFVRDLTTGKDLADDVIEGSRYANAAWLPDGSGFYYVGLPVDASIPIPEMPGHAEIRFHRLGTPASADTVVVPPTHDPTMFLGVGVSFDGHWLVVYKVRGEGNELWYRDLRKPGSELRALSTGFDAAVSVYPYRDKFYVLTNAGKPNAHVLRVDPAHPERARWKEIVPERDDKLEAAYVVGGKLVLNYLHAAHSLIEVHGLDGKLLRTVELPGIGSSSGLVGREDDDEAYYYFSSYTTPSRIFRTSVKKGGSDLWASVDVPVDTSQFTAEQVWYPSKDDTKVSMFLVHRKDLPRDGNNPVLLTGYGGFNVSLEPGFSSYTVAWVERGGVWAVPNLRGGGEYGEKWHEAGMRGNKQNVFDDFIGAAEYLVAEGYTKPERLAIMGGSNGGLLVGAAMTQRPELFGAVLCSVPLLDMVRYTKFGSGKTWIPEYGDPDRAEDFAWLYAYSPYHRVKEGTKYPAMLMLSADSDDRVDPMHARKFVAAVQAATTSDEPVLLRIETNAGHGGAGLRKKWVEQSVDELSFLFAQFGMPAAE
jgi:prolyl oligopeptidase